MVPNDHVLTHLTIRDLALVDRVELPFGPGLNVLTGETGAGKSVLVGALSIVLGGRAQVDAVRSGAKEAVVEALFDVPKGGPLAARLERLGIEAPDGQLVVRRAVGRGSRGRVQLNGQLATVSMLAQVLKGVVELTGQHEHVSLLDPDQHLEILDAYGGHGALRGEMAEAHAQVRRLAGRIAALERDDADAARREDYLRFALDEIQSLQIQPGEQAELDTERKRLRNLDELLRGVGAAEAAIYSDDGAAVEALGAVVRGLTRLAQLDPGVAGLVGAAEGTLAQLEDLGRDLGRYVSHLNAEPGRLEEVEERLEQLRRVCRKYGGSEQAVLDAAANMAGDLESLQNHEAQCEALEAELGLARAQCEDIATRLRAARRDAGTRLAAAVQQELTALALAGTRLQVQLLELSEPGARGAEAVELLFSANVGEPMLALRKSASGGELSRVLLAIKNVLATGVGTVACHVFDEVDTGMGGAVAEVLGAKLKSVAAKTQVIAVTHLPQVAAYADQHFVVSKGQVKTRTVTRVQALTEEERIEELARMVGGLQITAQTRGLAQELRDRGRSLAPRNPTVSGVHPGRRSRVSSRKRVDRGALRVAT